MIQISFAQLFVWVVTGGLAGLAAGVLVRRNKRGFGLPMNVAIGMIGALIGGVMFDILNITIAPGITFSLNDLIAAIVGSLVLVILLIAFQRFR